MITVSRPGVDIWRNWPGKGSQVFIRLDRDSFQALKDCFEVGYDGHPDDYPGAVQANHVSNAIDQFLQQEADEDARLSISSGESQS